jgi:hypothetical protein
MGAPITLADNSPNAGSRNAPPAQPELQKSHHWSRIRA